ncbi:unnamed protein product [Amoebophrya sp. A25]|nr:unnamed protein product [Amoebophrya sp. A25]|eukprot:GSA25T00013703001.1
MATTPMQTSAASPATSRSASKRPSLHADALQAGDGASIQDKKYLAGERRLSVTSLRLRSEVEMWLMEEVPKLFGVEDTDELDPSVQEDGQSHFLNGVLFCGDILDTGAVAEKVRERFGIGVAAQSNRFRSFVDELAAKIVEVRDAFAQARRESKEIPRDTPLLCAQNE